MHAICYYRLHHKNESMASQMCLHLLRETCMFKNQEPVARSLRFVAALA